MSQYEKAPLFERRAFSFHSFLFFEFVHHGSVLRQQGTSPQFLQERFYVCGGNFLCRAIVFFEQSGGHLRLGRTFFHAVSEVDADLVQGDCRVRFRTEHRSRPVELFLHHGRWIQFRRLSSMTVFKSPSSTVSSARGANRFVMSSASARMRSVRMRCFSSGSSFA